MYSMLLSHGVCSVYHTCITYCVLHLYAIPWFSVQIQHTVTDHPSHTGSSEGLCSESVLKICCTQSVSDLLFPVS